LTSFFSNAHPIKLSTFNQAEPVPDFAPDGYIYGVYGSDKKLYKINQSNASTQKC